MKKSIVYLVGAGPGDSGLMTVKGLEVLREADVVLYDRLVSPLLLQEVREDAELIYCGKLPNRHILRQESINQLLVEKGLEGKIVVRLKGGDPGVFGRVGEEAEALSNAKVPFEIVPGITSGIAAAAYAGIPVTHREYGTSFTVVTGHDKSVDGKPLINWNALANGIDTIAFYMGVKNLSHITEQLIIHGRSPETKVAVIQWGTTGRQKVVTGTLETIVSEVENKQLCNPAITIVGNIVKLRGKLKWFEDKKLLGERLIFPYGNSETVKELSLTGAEVVVYPKALTVDKTIDADYRKKLEQIHSFKQITFSSKAAFLFFLRSLKTQKIDIRSIKASFFGLQKEVVDSILDAGFFAEQIDKPVQEGDHLIICSEEESKKESFVNVLLTHAEKNIENQSVVFKRMMDEGGFTAVVFNSGKAVLGLVEQMEKDGYDFLDIMNSCRIFCVNDEARNILTSQFPNYTKTIYDFNKISRGVDTNESSHSRWSR